jgi:O-antigen ligase
VHPNELGAFCAIGALVAAGLALGGRSRAGRFLAGAAMLVLLAGLTLSFARGAWIGLALGLVYLLWALPRARRAAVVIGVPLVVAAALAGSFSTAGQTQIQVVGERVGAITTTSPYDNRREIWREAEREIREDPWTGKGPGNFPVSSVRAASAVSTVYAEHAHNLALTWGAESGLPALVLIGGLVVALGAAANRAARAAKSLGDARDRALVAGIVAALVAVLGQGLVDYTLRNAIIFLAVWALVGALLTARRELVSAADGSTRPNRAEG